MTPHEHISEVRLMPSLSAMRRVNGAHRAGDIRCPRIAHRGGARGFTLVEALVALALLAIGLASLAGVQARMRLSADDSRHQAEALRLARNELEMLRLHPERSGSALRWEGPSGDVELRSEVSGWRSGALPLRSVSVEAIWLDRAGETRRLSLETVIPSTPPVLPAILLVSDS